MDPPPAVMETVAEVLNEDRLAHPYMTHMFAIPSLMTNLCIRELSKDADVVLTINVGPSFWPRSMHENLIVLIVLPLAHVLNYRGTCVLQGESSRP